MADSKWSPDQYERFCNERQQPFFDLMALVRPTEGMRVVDLGCGTGELTRQLHQTLQAERTIGIDRSETMLAKSESVVADGLSFRIQRLEELDGPGSLDLIFSNAALHWVDDHPSLIARLTQALRPGGQLAVQMPANHDHVSHTIAVRLAHEEPFRTALQGFVRRSPVLPPEDYAALLAQLGYTEQHVRLQVYSHHLASRDEVVEWTKGTMLVAYQERMPEPLFKDFLALYKERLMPLLSPAQPFFYPFKRILLWGRLA
jgi:trans-aconitate 2-methyltransferase